jgi:O-antigen/teichoic acid export membrane protein
MNNGASQSVSVMHGAALTIALRWTDRLLGIVSTLVLARLLVPADFGIIAMASLVVLLVDTLLDLGVSAALVQNRDADRHDYDTAWTLRLAQSTLAAAVVATAAPLAAGYFGDGRVEAVLWVMAISVLVAGFENIGIVSFQKNMEFGREFKFFFLRRLAGFLVTLALALLLRNYWAMVLGTLAGRLVGVGLSYGMHEFRPRLSLARLRNLWSFSQWMLVRNLGTYGAQQVDKIVLGPRAGATTLGAYNLADDIGAMPVTELLAPIGRVLFPAFVQAADDPQALRRRFTLAFGIQVLIGLPAGVGLALVAETAVPLLLGEQWLPAIPLLQILALISVATALTHSSGYLLLALGKVRLQALFVWGQFLLLAALLVLAFPEADAAGIAQTRLGLALPAMLLFLAMALHAVPVLRLADLLAACWRPVIATGLMALVLIQWPLPASLPLALRLLLEVAAGGATYAASLLLLWWFAGSRDGPEHYMIDKLRPHRSPDTTTTIACNSYPSIEALPTPIRGQWQQWLQETGDRHPESRPEWFANLQQSVFKEDPGIRYAVAQRQDGCTAILPLRYMRQGPIRRIEGLTNFYTSLYEPPLANDAGPDELATLLRAVIREHGGADEMRFAPMDPDGPAYHHLRAALTRIGWASFPYFCFGNWHLHLDSDWQTYFTQRPGEVRSTIKRMGNKFAAAGGRLEILHGTVHLDDAIAAYGSVYSASWKIPEPYPEFMPGLIRLLAASSSLRLGIARLDGQAIAAQVWAVQGGRAAIIKLAHREDNAEYSAGTLLTALLMEHVIEVDKVSEVDYLIGDDSYKQNWMNRRRERWGLVAYNPRTSRGLILLGRELAARMIKAAIAFIRHPRAGGNQGH